MVRKKVKSKNKSRKTSINVRRKKVYTYSRFDALKDRYDGFLDQTVSVRSLLKYTSIVLLFFIVVGSSFMLGRLTYADSSGKVESVVEEPAPVEDVVLDPPEEVEPVQEPEQVYEVAEDPEPEEQYFEVAPAKPVSLSVAEFGYNYTKVGVDVSDLEKLERGTNWASVESLTLTVRNDEPGTIINPTRIKVKINPKGKGSNWWDDEVYLPDDFKAMRPGDEVSTTVKVHVSFSDIYSEKDFQLVVLDDYDVPIAWYKKIMTIK